MDKKQKTTKCPNCRNKIVIRARETKTGYTLDIPKQSGALIGSKIQCRTCGNIFPAELPKINL